MEQKNIEDILEHLDQSDFSNTQAIIQDQEIVADILKIKSSIVNEKSNFIPAKEGLKNALVNTFVTQDQESRYTIEDMVVKKDHILIGLQYSMKNFLKIGLPIVAIALLAVGVTMKKGMIQKTEDVAQTPSAYQEVTPPQATGNIDDVLLALDEEATEEAAVATQPGQSEVALSANAEVINSMATVYDESNF